MLVALGWVWWVASFSFAGLLGDLSPLDSACWEVKEEHPKPLWFLGWPRGTRAAPSLL